MRKRLSLILSVALTLLSIWVPQASAASSIDVASDFAACGTIDYNNGDVESVFMSLTVDGVAIAGKYSTPFHAQATDWLCTPGPDVIGLSGGEMTYVLEANIIHSNRLVTQIVVSTTCVLASNSFVCTPQREVVVGP